MSKHTWSKAPKLALWSGEGEGNGRTYVNPVDDSRHPSVTTILKNTPKADLMGWSAFKVAEVAIERYADLGGDPEQVMKWLPYAHTDYRNERGWVGSGVHATIQAEHEQSWDFYELDAEQLAMMEKWYEFCRVYQAEILYSECTVLGDGFMGTLDAFIRYIDPFTGEVRIALVDFKTSKSIWDDHHMQLAALANAECIFREVPKGTEGAYRRKGKVIAEDSYWVQEPVPYFDEVKILHLREDKYDFIDVDHVDLFYKEFIVYRDLFAVIQEIKDARKGAK